MNTFYKTRLVKFHKSHFYISTTFNLQQLSPHENLVTFVYEDVLTQIT